LKNTRALLRGAANSMAHSLESLWDILDEMWGGHPHEHGNSMPDPETRAMLLMAKLSARLEESKQNADRLSSEEGVAGTAAQSGLSSAEGITEYSVRGPFEEYSVIDAAVKFRLTQLMEASHPATALESIREEVEKMTGTFIAPTEKMKRSSDERPLPLLVFSDAGQDLDDELALIMLATLQRRKAVRIIGVVVNLAPSLQRAQLAKGTLNQLGLPDVPVAAGSDGGIPDHKETFSSSASSYIAPEEAIDKDAEAMMLRVLRAEEDGSVAMLCISSLKDAWMLLESHEALFVKKISLVTIQGGLDMSAVSADQRRGHILPDKASNNMFDMAAATRFYVRLQELNIRLHVLTRFAAYVVPMPRKLYDGMELTGSPIAKRLVTAQRTSIQELWQRCHAVGEARMGLPERCSTEWFRKTFLDGEGSERTSTDSIWDLVAHFNMYDVLALVFAVPSLSWRFYEPAIIAGTHENPTLCAVGLTVETPGIKEPIKLRDFVISGLIESLVLEC
jgi:hypothetical protein